MLTDADCRNATCPRPEAPTPPDVLRRIEKRGAVDSAHALRQTAGQVFRYGIQTGRCERSPAPDLHGALQSVTVKHMAAVLEPVEAGWLRRAIDTYTGHPGPARRGALGAAVPATRQHPC